MRNLIFLILSILFFNTYAADEIIRPEGVYTFSDVKVAQVRDQEIVPLQNTKRYLELMEQKYQCTLVTKFYKCQKHIKNVELPFSIKNKLKKETEGKSFEFALSPMSPELINEAESINEWLVFDLVTFDGEQTSEYHYYLLKGSDGSEVHKAMIGFANNPQWPVIENSKTLYVPVQQVLKNGKFTSRIFELSLYFTK